MNLKDFQQYEAETSNYTPPEYLVQPAPGDKGFFMFKSQFDALKGKKRSTKDKKKFTPAIKWKFADESIHLDNYESFSVNEQDILIAIDELSSYYLTNDINEGFLDWVKKVGDFFAKINDSIRNLMLTMAAKGLMALNTLKKFFDTVMDKIKGFKESHPVLFRTIIITLILIVLFFVLCSAASGKHEGVPDGVIDAAIGFLKRLQAEGTSEYDNGALMKAQAYLFELKKGGSVSNPEFGKQVVAMADGAIKIVQDNAKEIKTMAPGEAKNQSIEYLIDLAEKGSRMVGYKIIEYQNSLTGKYAGETVQLVSK